MNYCLEFFGGIEIVSTCEANESNKKSCQAAEQPTMPSRERKEEVNRIYHDVINPAIFVLIVMSPFFDVPPYITFIALLIWFLRL